MPLEFSNFPAGHNVQVVDPMSSENVPSEHALHCPVPTVFLNLPLAHCTHTANWPPPLPETPGEHTHSFSESDPVASVDVSAGQTVQSSSAMLSLYVPIAHTSYNLLEPEPELACPGEHLQSSIMSRLALYSDELAVSMF